VEEAWEYPAVTVRLFGIPFSLPAIVLIGFAIACATFAFWSAHRALKTGVHEWKTGRAVRSKTPKLFAFQVGLVLFLGFMALMTGVVVAFNLGMKP
jgi:hypothetical protein